MQRATHGQSLTAFGASDVLRGCISAQPAPQCATNLLNGNANAQGVDRALDEDALALCSADDHRCEEHLLALAACVESRREFGLAAADGQRVQHPNHDTPDFDFRLVVSLDHLRGEALQAHGRGERIAHRLQVRGQSLRLRGWQGERQRNER